MAALIVVVSFSPLSVKTNDRALEYKAGITTGTFLRDAVGEAKSTSGLK
jgi:hypothetical protein